MFQQFFNWRTALALAAIGIVIGTIFYSKYLARKIAREERQKVELWIEAGKSLLDPNITDTRLPSQIITANDDIPIIETDGKDSILSYVNLNVEKATSDPSYLKEKLKDLKSTNQPIIYTDPYDSTRTNRYYYGHTALLDEVQYYPLIQLFIVGLFIVVIFLLVRSNYRSVQNQVWAGMAKETAHQLGTPVSSLEGWVEMMKENPGSDKMVHELEKDVKRLRLVSDRFGKIGSTPQLETVDIIVQISNMVEYIRKRAPGKIRFELNTHGQSHMYAKVSPPLFDWVIENLLKNALDAMEGKGLITVDIQDVKENIVIDVTDTGKGIAKQNIGKVFKPGFTTKKRGWGLGLSLSKRIMEKYHKGEIFVKHSEPGKGTTFRIILKNPLKAESQAV